MESKRKVIRQLMLIIRSIEASEVKLKELSPIMKDGEVAGYAFEVVEYEEEKPRLRLVGQKDD